MVPLYFSRRRPTHYSERWHVFSVTILSFCKDVYINNFFIKELFSGLFCFGNLNAFLWSMIWKASLGLELIKTFLLQFVLNKFFYVLSCFVLLVTPCLIKAVQPCMEWIPILKKAHLPICRCAICRYTVGSRDVSVRWSSNVIDKDVRS